MKIAAGNHTVAAAKEFTKSAQPFECRFCFLIFSKKQTFVINRFFEPARKTNLHLKVGSSGLGVKLNVL